MSKPEGDIGRSRVVTDVERSEFLDRVAVTRKASGRTLFLPDAEAGSPSSLTIDERVGEAWVLIQRAVKVP